MNQTSEQDLLSGARALDPSALTAIYTLYSPGIYRYAMRLLGDDCLAEDCVAETFSRYLKAIKSGQGPQDHLQAYLYRIAHNWITDCYRRQPPPPLELDETVPEAEPNLPETQVCQELEKQQVRLALRSLTPDQRQVVSLRFLEGWDYEEIVLAMNKPAGTIRALQFRALTTLRKLLRLDSEKEGSYVYQK
jgi:RNA polymerase sigma-70 factor (ECF subfamily)